jgi:hypothetical protein
MLIDTKEEAIALQIQALGADNINGYATGINPPVVIRC